MKNIDLHRACDNESTFLAYIEIFLFFCYVDDHTAQTNEPSQRNRASFFFELKKISEKLNPTSDFNVSSVTSINYYAPRKAVFESPGVRLSGLESFTVIWVVLGILEKGLFKKVVWFVLGVS